MIKEQPTNKFCAVNNTEIMLFNEERLPIISSISKILTNFNTKEIKNITTKTNLSIQEFLFEQPVFIHSLNSSTKKISLNKVKSIIHYNNLKELYRIRPYLLNSFDITQKNCIIDQELCTTHLDLQNINRLSFLKNNKYFGKRIDQLSLNDFNLELSMDLGFIFGQWFSRGYIDKSNKQHPRFTWVSLEEDSHKLLSLVNKCFKVGIFHRSKINTEKYDYIQIIDIDFNQKLIDIFSSNKFFANWIYSAPYSFLNGMLYGIFFTNGTISFNKDKTKAYMTIKFLNQSLAESFNSLLNIKYNLQGVLSLVPDKKYCKLSFQLNKSFFKILENGFTYGYIENQNKKDLMQNVKDNTDLIEYDNNPFSNYSFKVQKITVNSGFNFKISGAKAFSLLNGILIPSL
jgi:hypothetical protein